MTLYCAFLKNENKNSIFKNIDTFTWNTYLSSKSFFATTKQNIDWNSLLEICVPNFEKVDYCIENDQESICAEWFELNLTVLFQWSKSIYCTIIHSINFNTITQIELDTSKMCSSSDIIVCQSIPHFASEDIHTVLNSKKYRFGYYALCRIIHDIKHGGINFDLSSDLENMITKYLWKLVYDFIEPLNKINHCQPRLDAELLNHVKECEPLLWITESNKKSYDYCYTYKGILNYNKNVLFSPPNQTLQKFIKMNHSINTMKYNVPCLVKIQLQINRTHESIKWCVKKCMIDEEGQPYYKRVQISHQRDILQFDTSFKIKYLVQLIVHSIYTIVNKYDPSQWMCDQLISVQTNDSYVYHYFNTHLNKMIHQNSKQSNMIDKEMYKWSSGWMFLYSIKSLLKVTLWNSLCIKMSK